MRRICFSLLLLSALCAAGTTRKPAHARNVILLLADAGGIPILNAASIVGYDAPQKLYVQSWPNIALSDTSPASEWVTDSAAGMTAIVTGHKSYNGVISEATDSVPGKKEGTPLKTLLEYAEERGLSTGVVSNVTIADATPAACYAHVDDRARYGDIFLQIFTPRFGDGVDIVFGPGRKEIFDAVRSNGKDLDQVAREHKRPVLSSLSEVPAGARRAIVVVDGEISLEEASKKAIRALSRNPKGYFLMIESDAHTDDPEGGLSRLVAFDRLIREISGIVNPEDTLLLFTADHSFDLRVESGNPKEPLLKGYNEWKKSNGGKSSETVRLPFVRVDNSHTGEEVLVTAKGPGAERVHGFLPNTRLFHIMMDAYGWSDGSESREPAGGGHHAAVGAPGGR